MAPLSVASSISSRSVSRLLMFAILFLLIGSSAFCQQMGTTLDSHQYDTIDLVNLSVYLNAPAHSKPGMIPRNSSMFGAYGPMIAAGINGCTPGSWQILNSNCSALVPSTFTFQTNTGTHIPLGGTITTVSCGTGQGTTNKYTNYVLVDAVGVSHTLFPSTLYMYSPTRGTCTNVGQSATTTDGSGYSISNFSLSTATITDGSGNVIGSGGFSDPNGNTVNANDSLGIAWSPSQYYDANSNLRVFSIPTSSVNTATNFGCASVVDAPPGTSTLPTGFSFPDGTSLSVGFEQTAGKSGYYTGRIASLTLPTGGTINYGYSGGDAPGPGTGIWCGASGSGHTPGLTPTLTRTTPEGTWTYTQVQASPPTTYVSTTTVTDPSGNNSVYSFVGTFEVQRQIYQGSVSPSNLLHSKIICYNGKTNLTNCANGTASGAGLPITEEDVYASIPGVTGSSEVATSYDPTYGMVTGVKQYDFGASSPTLIKTITYGSYSGGSCAAISTTIHDRPCEITISDGTHTSSDRRFTYDSKGSLLTASSLVSGTPTAGTWLTSATTHNANGTVNTVTDAAGMVTTFGYNGTGGCNGMLPTSKSVGTATTTYFTTYATYDCVGGKVLTTTDANGQITTNSYSANGADPFYALKTVTGPLAETVTLAYTPTSAESTMSFGAVTQNSYSYVDTLGRLSEGQSLHGSNYDTVIQAYGWGTASNGAPAPYGAFGTTTAVPCSVTLGAPCPGSSPVTTTYLDALGRTSSVVDAGGGTINYTYTDQDVIAQLGPAPAGENVKKVQTEYDGLGRVKSVCQILSSGGSPCGQATAASGNVTTVAYSLLAGGAQVSATRGVQTRTKIMDALGRITSVSTPESGTVLYIYDTSSYCNYTSKGDLVEQVDAVNHVCYYYDAIHRISAIWTTAAITGDYCTHFRYDSGSNGVLGAPPAGVTLNYPLGRLVEAETDNDPVHGNCASPITQSTILTDEWFSYDAEGHLTDIWESTPHSGGYYHTTVGYLANDVPSSLGGIPGYTAISYGVDSNGNPNRAWEGSTNIVSSVTYSTEGAPLTVAIGNGSGDTSNYGYDPNTGRMTNWTFTVGSTPQSQTGTLNWNPNGTLRQLTIGDGFNTGGNQTCNFGTSSTMGYDDLGRLLSDVCGSVWSQTFSYDQYDNITKTGSTSWACTACYNSANNQYNSTLSPSITYDLNGRLTNDTFQKYAWNAYGQLSGTVGVTGGSINCGSNGFCYTYDAFGRMVESSQGSTYHEILYSPLGKTATMNAQVASSSYLPLPGGSTLYSTGNSGTNRFYQHKDWLGSARVESSVSNRTVTYDRAFAPYGEMYDNFGATTQLNFTGDMQDFDSNSKLFDTPSRELHTSQGRWISPDPSGAGWNAYAYSANPNSETDPSGLDPQEPCMLCTDPSASTRIMFDIPQSTLDWLLTQNMGPVPGVVSTMPPLPGMSTDFTSGLGGFMQGNFGPSIYGRTNGHAPGWVLQRLDHIKTSAQNQSTAATVMSGLNAGAHAVSDFFQTYIKEIDSNIPFSGVSSPSANNGTEKAAVGAGFLAGFLVPEGEGAKGANSVYTIGKDAYVGITNNLERRAAEHGAELTKVAGGLTREGARGVEQALIEHHGLENLGNKINSIAKSNPIYERAVQFGRQFLQSIGSIP